MIKIINFFRKYWFLILISLVVVFVIVDKLIIPDKKITPTTQGPTTDRVADYKSIQPGVTTLKEINNLLGFPVKENEENGKNILEYNSSNKYRNNIVIVQNGVAVLIKEIITSTDNKKSQDITNEFGVAPNKLYSKSSSATFDLYVYPTNGIAYLGHEDGTILEIWYFQPTTIENFSSLWATEYLTEKSNIVPKY